MTASASNLADSLSRHAEAVCRRYLSNGRRSGGYWIVGDVRNAPGASTFVRLKSRGGKGAVGNWSDAATGEHGDLLDVIRETCGLVRFRDVADEARCFLNLPRPAREKSIELVICARTSIVLGRAPARVVPADRRHACGSLSQASRRH